MLKEQSIVNTFSAGRIVDVVISNDGSSLESLSVYTLSMDQSLTVHIEWRENKSQVFGN